MVAIDVQSANFLTVRYGMGSHYDTLSENDKINSLRWFWASVWIYYLALCFTKLSILVQYLRIFPNKGFRVACYILMGIVSAYSIATFFTSIFVCIPIESFWDRSLKGRCLNQVATWYDLSPLKFSLLLS